MERVCYFSHGLDRVAQLVEQRTFNPQAAGSIPAPVIHLAARGVTEA